MLHRLYTFAIACTFVLGISTSVQAGDAVLTVTHNGETTTYDRAALDMLGTQRIETTTIWTEGVQTFEGVSLHRLAQEIGVEQGTLFATAINDYTVEIPVTDAVEGGPIVAMRLNGSEMSVRDKGPLWVIYPYDADQKYQTEVIYSRSIWQLDRIEVVD